MIKQDIHSWIESNKEKIIELRRWLHRNPEVGFKEFRTSQYLSKILSDKGYDIVKNDKMKTGFYCDYQTDTPMLALRTDMDALEIEENNIIQPSIIRLELQ